MRTDRKAFALVKIEIIYPQVKVPTLRAVQPHGEPLLHTCTRITRRFWAIFLGWEMLPHPGATSTDYD